MNEYVVNSECYEKSISMYLYPCVHSTLAVYSHCKAGQITCEMVSIDGMLQG